MLDILLIFLQYVQYLPSSHTEGYPKTIQTTNKQT